MALFSYTGTTADGVSVAGSEEALDRFELARMLRTRGIKPLSATAAGDAAPWKKMLSLDFFSRIKLEEKIFFANNMSAMLSAGLSLSRTLVVLERQNKNPRFAKVLTALSSDISKGETLSVAMKKHEGVFPSVFVAMVAAGESSGKLADALRLVGDQLSKTYATRRKIKSAFMYPTVIMCLAFVIGIIMLVYIVPTLADTFTQLKIELPWSTQVIIGLSHFFEHHFLIAFGGAIAFFFAARSWLRRPIGIRFKDTLAVRIPIVSGLVKNMNAAVTARTLSSLVASGVDIMGALETTSAVVQNSYYRQILKDAQKSIEKGGTLASVFEKHTDLYPAILGEMVEVGEETGKLSDMLVRVALFYEEQVDAVTKDLSTLVEPFLMILIGGIVMFFAVSMIQPIYGLTSAL